MCRHAAYVGPPVAIDSLTHGHAHDLEHQAYQARELLTGVVCADGFGVTWYEPSVRPEPARYASVLPLWNDQNLRSMGALVQSGCIMAAVRNATVPDGLQESNCAPFVDGRHAFSLNGFLTDFDATWRTWCLERIPASQHARIRGSTDGEFLFHAILARVDAGEDLPTATQTILRDACDRARELSQEVQLNVLVTDGQRIVATRAGTSPTCNSLYVLRDGDDFPGGIVVASEPIMDDPAWEPVGEHALVVLQAGAPPVRLTV